MRKIGSAAACRRSGFHFRRRNGVAQAQQGRGKSIERPEPERRYLAEVATGVLELECGGEQFIHCRRARRNMDGFAREPVENVERAADPDHIDQARDDTVTQVSVHRCG